MFREDTDLAKIESIVYFVFERTHLYLTNEFWLNLGIPKNSRQQFIEMRQEKLHLVVNRRVECG